MVSSQKQDLTLVSVGELAHHVCEAGRLALFLTWTKSALYSCRTDIRIFLMLFLGEEDVAIPGAREQTDKQGDHDAGAFSRWGE